MMGADGVVDLHDGEVSSNPIGANVQTAGYDIARLNDNVIFDNDDNFDMSALPIPEPATGF